MAETEWLTLLERSLRVEEKEQFRNVKGREYFFADFMLQQFERHRGEPRHSQIYARLKNIYTLYPMAAVAERREFVAETWKHLDTLRVSSRPERVTTQRIKAEMARQPAVNDWREVPVQFVKGVGPKLGEKLAAVGVATVGDLLHYFPRKHLDYSRCTRIRDLEVGQLATVWGSVYQVSSFTPPGKQGLFILKLTVRDESGRLQISFFHRGNAFMRKQFESRFPVGAQVLMSGTVKWDRFLKGLTLDAPECEVLGDTEDSDSFETPGATSLHVGRIVPIYPLTEGLNVKWVRKAIFHALQAYQDKITDPLPRSLLQRRGLFPLAQAYREYHYPSDEDRLEQARQRLVFNELLLTQLGLQYRRKQRELHEPGVALASAGKLVQAFLEQLPFALTGAQQRVWGEILSDLRRPEPMGRLVQGDVGSGKTVVAVLALLEAVESGFQGALMAPTEILAEQHFQKMYQWLLPLGVQAELLVGGQGAKERRAVLARLASGEAQVAIGTHALIQDAVQFHKLGLVVIDEQHRFGVKQRSILRDKGQHPEVLSMTATPIPRTLALTLYGDLEVSQIDELPPGRQPVDTQLIRGAQREQLWDLMRQELDAGRQAYLVFPLVEESEKMDLKAATVEYVQLSEQIFPDRRVGLLHGQMKGSDKDAIMRSFVRHELDILVSTTVIEVGVDVPNASVMVIEHAERFGLAQLHQLRGRVGRGADKAYCFLVSDKLSELAKERLTLFTQTNDGFVIAEQDLRLRGPGEFLGTRQSGLPDLVLTDLVADTALLEMAREDAKTLIAADPELVQAEHAALKREMFRFFKRHTGVLEA
ncbi:MAG: ATP-dependent DNA helicase RecG [Candidatus Sericytochromatia bacterium]